MYSASNLVKTYKENGLPISPELLEIQSGHREIIFSELKNT